MKGFFLLLLLTNLGFVAWQYLADTRSVVSLPYGGVTPKNEGLTLLSELKEEERPTARDLVSLSPKAKEEATQEPPPMPVEVVADDESKKEDETTVRRCYQSEMLAELEEAKELEKRLRQMGIKESQHRAVETTVVNYWVKLNPYKSREKANEAADILRKNRVRDFFIVRSGRHENAISLGVFSTLERAEKRFNEISGLKAHLRDPVIEAMELPAKRLLVEFALAPGKAPADFEKLLNPAMVPHVKKVACGE